MKNGGNEPKAWNPYAAGAVSGIVIASSVWLTGKYAGASTSFVRSAGMLEKLFAPDRVATLEYFSKEAPIVEWQWMFVFGILAGAFLSSIISGAFRLTPLPPMWERRFGPGIPKRALFAVTGGAIAMFGARLADG